MEMPYYGESKCNGTYCDGRPCKNYAYYKCGSRVFCGMHSRKRNRIELERNPRADKLKQQRYEMYKQDAEAAATKNREAGKAGHVIVRTMHMMRAVECVKGYTMVFPNYRHNNRRDGYGCSALSPKSLGPIHHIMPNLPPAKNLENFHQFSKVYPFEIDKETNEQNIGWFQYRIRGYQDPEAHVHKHDPVILKSYFGKNIQVCSYSLYYNKNGTARKFSYAESRYFYCKLYEQLVKDTEEFQQLCQWIRDGRNLQIMGYDGYDVTAPLIEHYRDISRPFGHELVLFSLLTIKDPADYPWNIEYNLHKEHYEGFGI